MGRKRILSVLPFVAFLVGLAATLMVFGQDRLFDASSFSTTLTSTLEEPAVNDYLADAISTELIEQVPDLAISGPLLADVTGSVLASDVAAGIIESAASDAHRSIFDGGNDTLVLELSDLVITIDHALAAISPELGDVIPDGITDLTVDLSSGELTAGTVRLADRLRSLTIVLVVVFVALLLTLVVLDPSVFRGLARVGLVLGSVGLALIVLRVAGADIIASYGRDEREADALEGVWNVVLGDLQTWGWSLAVVGGLFVGLGWAVLHRGRVDEALRAAWERLTLDRSSATADLVRGMALLAVAAWALFGPASIVDVAVRIAGFALAVVTLARLADRFGLTDRLAGLDVESDDVLSPKAVAKRAVLPVAALVLLGGFGIWLLGADDEASALPDPDACNGHVELCDRRLDEVTMAASHNAMSSTASGFLLPNHLTTIRAQLDQGVRGLMIDTIYGQRAGNGSVRTSFDLVDVDSLDDDARAAAEAVRSRQGADLEEQRVFLCHGFCEIGAVDAIEVLTEIRQWIESNPREVLVFVVQDATSPADTAAAFEQAGFADLVHTQSLGEPLPTLGEMIDSGRRVFVMVEEDAGDIAWLHPAFEFSQETPFSFGSADEFTCVPNRGRDDSPLFVVNHFITLARASNQDINDRAPLLGRAEDCRDERGLHPNLLAVDFVSRGDVMAVVDELNGLAE